MLDILINGCNTYNMGKRSEHSIKPRSVAWLGLQSSEEVESVLNEFWRSSDRGQIHVQKPDEWISVNRRDTRLNGANNYDQGIDYKDFSPPPIWQVPYSILRATFQPEPKTVFMSHLGEEILVPISSSAGKIQYHFLIQKEDSTEFEKKHSPSLKYGQIIRVNSIIPHHTWAEGGQADAWMIFEDASGTAPSIRTQGVGLEARTFKEEEFKKNLAFYHMVASGISETIRLYRNRSNFQIGNLATLCEIDRTHLSKAEVGKANLSIEALKRIANVLGLDIPSMLTAERWTHIAKELEDIAEDSQYNPLCEHEPHYLHPRIWKINEGVSKEISAISVKPFETFTSLILLSGEVILETSMSAKKQASKVLLQEGSVLHLRYVTNCQVEARENSVLLEVVRSPLCSKYMEKRSSK